MTNNKILPCPFCGAMAVLITGGEHFSYVECPECGAKLPASTGKNRNADAINAWNKRALSERESELIETLENALGELLYNTREHTINTIEQAREIQDFLRRIESEKDGEQQ